jgi:DNA/RNA endonuclease YhcR with UshA esterase domain
MCVSGFIEVTKSTPSAGRLDIIGQSLTIYNMNLNFTQLISVLLLLAVFVRADEPATQQVVIDASDKATIDANMNQPVIIKGEIKLAEWSKSGKVMNIEFANTDESKLLAVIFEKNRKAMDKAYSGDVAKTLTGAKVRLEGVLKPYGGKAESLKGRPQIIIDRITQITIVEPAPKAN